MADPHQPYVTIRARRPGDGSSVSSADSTVCNLECPHNEFVDDDQKLRRRADLKMAQHAPEQGEYTAPSATHDTSRVSYHVKHLDTFAKTLEDVSRVVLFRRLTSRGGRRRC